MKWYDEYKPTCFECSKVLNKDNEYHMTVGFCDEICKIEYEKLDIFN